MRVCLYKSLTRLKSIKTLWAPMTKSLKLKTKKVCLNYRRKPNGYIKSRLLSNHGKKNLRGKRNFLPRNSSLMSLIRSLIGQVSFLSHSRRTDLFKHPLMKVYVSPMKKRASPLSALLMTTKHTSLLESHKIDCLKRRAICWGIKITWLRSARMK